MENFSIIQKAYKQKAREFHPDKVKNNSDITPEQAAENFRCIKKSYDKLKDVFLEAGKIPNYECHKKVADQVSYISKCCQESKETGILNISCCLLKTIPNSLYMIIGAEKLDRIHTLDVSYNQIGILSDRIFSKFKNLKKIVAKDCLIRKIGNDSLGHSQIEEIFLRSFS